MLIFISGSVNAGKSSTSKLLAKRLGFEWMDFDQIAAEISNFSLDRDIPKVIQIGVDRINELDDSGKSVVANYVLRPEDYEALQKGLKVKEQHYITLAPRLEIARSDRGRGMNDWEYERIKFHYDTGVANPPFGEVIDTSDMSLEQSVEAIMNMISKSNL